MKYNFFISYLPYLLKKLFKFDKYKNNRFQNNTITFFVLVISKNNCTYAGGKIPFL